MNLHALTLGNLKADLLWRRLGAGTVKAIAMLLVASMPALAHHPFGGETPNNAIEAFLSGMGHPVIGVDHLAFVIAAGLLAAAMGGGLLIPIVFVGTAIGGTGIHLLELNLPVPELVIAASVLGFGSLLALKNQPRLPIVLGIAAIAGLFHGFAYGEAIWGAEMGPLLAYLLGFSTIQLAIAAAAFGLGQALLKQGEPSGLGLRFAGFVVCGVGATVLLTQIVDSLLPA